MAVGAFLSHTSGFLTTLKSGDWAADDHYAVLVTTTGTPSRTTWLTYSDITNECADGGYVAKDLAGETVATNGTNVKFDCDKINFGDTVTISARYLIILIGTVSTSGASDEIVGSIDLDGTGNVSSVAAEFSFDPAASEGLFQIAATSAA